MALEKAVRLATSLRDVLNWKYGQGSCVDALDSSGDVYLTLTVSGATAALIKLVPIETPAQGAYDHLGLAQRVYVPLVSKLGFDLGVNATQFFTMADPASNPTGVVAKNTVTLNATIATNTATINGVVFTCVAATATRANNEFNVGATDTLTAVQLAQAINSSSSTGVANVYAVANAATVIVYGKFPGTSLNAYAFSAVGGTMTWTAATFTLATPGTAGSTVVVNGKTFTSVNAADYAIVLPAGKVGPGTLYFSEATSKATNAITVAAVINALPTASWTNARKITAAVDGVTPEKVNLTAPAGSGAGGNSYTLAKTGTLVASVNAATFAGGTDTAVNPTVRAWVQSLLAVSGTEVRVYAKASIALGDLVDANIIDTFQDPLWKLLSQQ
jgi:hypothetical protein